MTDPLAGKREAINRGKLRVLLFRGDRPCPVSTGDTFKLRACSIQIGKISRRLVREGFETRQEWRVSFTRRVVEENFYLGKATFVEARSLRHGDHWDYREEHGYSASHDALEAGACIPSDHQERLSREADVVSAARRRKLREQTQELEAEARLAKSRHRPSTVRVLDAKRERAERRLRAA